MVDANLNREELDFCDDLQCCGKFVAISNRDNKKMLIPFKDVMIRTHLMGPMAATTVELKYVNLGQDSLESTFVLPLDKKSVLSSFTASIDDREIVTQVVEKDRATRTYEDAIAGGKAAVMATRSKKNEEVLTIAIGNIQPG